MIDRETVIAMAKEAGQRAGVEFHKRWLSGDGCSFQDIRDYFFAQAIAQKAAEAEREACAHECDHSYHRHIGPAYGEIRYGIAACARAIRARGTGGAG